MLCEPPPPFTPAFRYQSGPVEILAFGRKPRDKKPFDWNLSKTDIDKIFSYEEMGQTGELAEAIENISRRYKLSNFLAPNTSAFNAHVCEPESLTTQAFFSKEKNMAFACGIPGGMRRGIDADGVVLLPGHTFAVASADCPTLVLWDSATGKTIAAHAGFRSLYDHEHIADGKPCRKHASVVDAALDAIKPSQPHTLRAFIACGISAKHFNYPTWHPIFGKNNNAILNHLWDTFGKQCFLGSFNSGEISLRDLAKAQFARRGVQAVGYDTICTHEDTDEIGEYTWWSYRRGDKNERNLVLVTRRW